MKYMNIDTYFVYNKSTKKYIHIPTFPDLYSEEEPCWHPHGSTPDQGRHSLCFTSLLFQINI